MWFCTQNVAGAGEKITISTVVMEVEAADSNIMNKKEYFS